VEERDPTRGEGQREDGAPAAEEPWQRHVRILDLLKEIRAARARRRPADPPERGR
jgi:hypothetical protein